MFNISEARAHDRTHSIISDNFPVTHIFPDVIQLTPLSSNRYSFGVKLHSSQYDGKVPASLLQRSLSQQQAADIDKLSVILICNPQNNEKKEKGEEDVSEDFVTGFNSHFGNDENQEKAERLIKKMRRLGGLIPSSNKQNIDIPAARLGLSILAGLNNPKYKMQALESLLLLLKNDNLEKETSIHLVTLAIRLMTKMNRELIQTEVLDVQIKITQAYSLVAELLQRHYSKKHINAITKELKLELLATIKALEALNTQEDSKLDFYTNLALEGVRRLVDDRKELFDLIERFYHATASIGAYQLWDAATCFQHLAMVFKDLDPHLPNVWYNGVLILNELAKDAKKNINKLIGIQVVLREKGNCFDWKFTYAALELLYELSVHGETEKIRKLAFEGIKIFGPSFPGLASFANYDRFSRQLDLSPITHLRIPKCKDPNIAIRQASVEYLIKIVKEAPDIIIRKKATLVLIRRYELEQNKDIKALIEEFIQKTKETQDEELKKDNEKKHIVRIHRKKYEVNSQ